LRDHLSTANLRDVIASIHCVVYNIRESIKFIKASATSEEKFAEIALHLETICLEAPSAEHWKKVEFACTYLTPGMPSTRQPSSKETSS
jgi:hypothetical protein